MAGRAAGVGGRAESLKAYNRTIGIVSLVALPIVVVITGKWWLLVVAAVVVPLVVAFDRVVTPPSQRRE